ncbi:MAG TPA: SAM-dependent chlorinase/fluorinase [Microthrixaceae bacterium]|nr:SAM-dependent chlorinase/fluorinase [Microthrixaceae bacterium]
MSAGASRYDTVTLLSDLGTADGYVGVLHSIVRQLAPGAGVVDLTHEIEACDVQAGALVLARSVQYLCPGVIVGLVDPGVGSDRRPIALEVTGGAAVLIGPDNGLLASAVGMIGGAERAVVLDNVDYHLRSDATTFAARDIFAPVAAHLCAGVAFEDLGTLVDPATLTPGLVPLNRTEQDADGTPVLEAEALWVDRFGNVQLNAELDDVAEFGDLLEVRTTRGARTVSLVSTYSDLADGAIGLLVDSDGLLSLVTYGRSASTELVVSRGDAVSLRPISDDGTATSTTVALGPTRRLGGG